MTPSTPEIRRAIRRVARAHRTCPVHVVDGDSRPLLAGESYYWTWTPNPNGTRIRSNRGRAMHRSYYHASTLRVEVGADWLRTVIDEAGADGIYRVNGTEHRLRG